MEELNRHFTKTDNINGNKHMERHSTPLGTRELQITTI